MESRGVMSLVGSETGLLGACLKLLAALIENAGHSSHECHVAKLVGLQRIITPWSSEESIAKGGPVAGHRRLAQVSDPLASEKVLCFPTQRRKWK